MKAIIAIVSLSLFFIGCSSPEVRVFNFDGHVSPVWEVSKDLSHTARELGITQRIDDLYKASRKMQSVDGTTEYKK